MPNYQLNQSPPYAYVLDTGQALPAGWTRLSHEPIAGTDYPRLVPRSLFAIRADLLALTAAQKQNINTDLFGGSPPKWTQDTGPNDNALYGLWCQSQISTLSAADVTTLKLAATACYVQDNPTYLVHPAFDSTISVAGTQAG